MECGAFAVGPPGRAIAVVFQWVDSASVQDASAYAGMAYGCCCHVDLGLLFWVLALLVIVLGRKCR